MHPRIDYLFFLDPAKQQLKVSLEASVWPPVIRVNLVEIFSEHYTQHHENHKVCKHSYICVTPGARINQQALRREHIC